jgi:colanic acid/amylovoran biosynthesis protein
MRILIDNSSYHLKNQGDVAMLVVAVERLRELWPNAIIEVFTDAPDILLKYCPSVHPLSVRGRNLWLKSQNLFDSFYKFFPKRFHRWLLKIDEIIKFHFPIITSPLYQWKTKRRAFKNEYIPKFLFSLQNADLVIASGGGYLTDAFEYHAIGILSILGMAIKSGKPTAMLGQGLGPIQSWKLLACAKTIFPYIDLISLREKRAGLSILQTLSVPFDRIIITGDDAIELAYNDTNIEQATGIGINLRASGYSKLNEKHIEIVRSVLKNAAQKYKTHLIPLPISLVDKESDAKTIYQIISGIEVDSDGGRNIDSITTILEQIRRCRVVVTGSYHAGVFALSQGIPVICLAQSNYYVDKFKGLADQFGIGCEVVMLDDEQLHKKLLEKIHDAWLSNKIVRPELLKAAKQQIKLSRLAYQRLYKLVSIRKPSC